MLSSDIQLFCTISKSYILIYTPSLDLTSDGVIFNSLKICPKEQSSSAMFASDIQLCYSIFSHLCLEGFLYGVQMDYSEVRLLITYYR